MSTINTNTTIIIKSGAFMYHNADCFNMPHGTSQPAKATSEG